MIKGNKTIQSLKDFRREFFKARRKTGVKVNFKNQYLMFKSNKYVIMISKT